MRKEGRAIRIKMTAGSTVQTISIICASVAWVLVSFVVRVDIMI